RRRQKTSVWGSKMTIERVLPSGRIRRSAASNPLIARTERRVAAARAVSTPLLILSHRRVQSVAMIEQARGEAPPGPRAGLCPLPPTAAGRWFLVSVFSRAGRGPQPEGGHVVRELPDRPDLDQLRRQARELQRAAADGEENALRRLGAVATRPTLAAAQLALAREHGYRSWARLKAEIERR